MGPGGPGTCAITRTTGLLSHARLPPWGAHSWVPCLPASQGAFLCRVGGGGWGARQEYGEKASGILLKWASRQSARPRGCAGTLAWPCVRPLVRNVPVTGSQAVGMHSLYICSCGAYSGPGQALGPEQTTLYLREHRKGPGPDLQGFLGKPEAHKQNSGVLLPPCQQPRTCPPPLGTHLSLPSWGCSLFCSHHPQARPSRGPSPLECGVAAGPFKRTSRASPATPLGKLCG